MKADLRFLFTTFCFLCLLNDTELWKADRRPKIKGLPLKVLSPERREIQKKIVSFHNYFRTKVIPKAANMLRMKWHKSAAKSAQTWADECKFLIHDNATGRHVANYGTCGQNIFVATHQVPWFFAIKSWWLEKDNFIYGSSKNNLTFVGHYTTMVWAATHEVGCGLTKCVSNNKNGTAFGKSFYNYVCNYCPMGNRPGRVGKPYKRGKPCALCKNNCYKNKLCTNRCPIADLWANCRELKQIWPVWLCETKTPKGLERLRSCRATCRCEAKVHD